MLYPMANMDVRANSVMHLECRFAAKVQRAVRGFIGSKVVRLRAFFSRRSTDFGAGKHSHCIDLPAAAISNPWIQSKRMRARYPGNGIE
jgi:hypothetical protein